MQDFGTKPVNASVEDLGIKNATTHWNLPAEVLAQISIDKGQAKRSSTGAINIHTGKFTGRSPKDRFIVKDEITENTVWWGNINIPFEVEKFDKLYSKVCDYLSGKEIYARDVYACADPRYKLNIRTVNEYAWSNLFVYNMFLKPSKKELDTFEPEWTVINAPGFLADSQVDGTRQANFAILNFSRKIVLIGGTGYTGEIKKGIFSALNFILPEQKNILSMHCSANMGDVGDTAIFFGLSGTGKTTLSTDPKRQLIGDDEHGWSDRNTIFNFEGGCYAKVIGLSEEKEPDIFRSIRSSALLENVVFKNNSDKVDYEDPTITENTRVSYPIHHINNIVKPSIGTNPKNIFFLTCDAYGVLPPISRLTSEQAAFHFISGYTAKIAGTEAGITEPKIVFSACFGAPFMPLHPTKYAKMLSDRIQATEVKVWLINTGWSGGVYGIGSRMSLSITRALITSVLERHLNNVEFVTHEIFGLAMPTECLNVPSKVLNPRNTWKDKSAYDKKANQLARAFNTNFEKYAKYANDEIIAGAPIPKSNT